MDVIAEFLKKLLDIRTQIRHLNYHSNPPSLDGREFEGG